MTLPLPLQVERSPAVAAAVAALAAANDVTERGAIFTRPEVVAGILDLVGYTADRPLHRLRLLEPSCGEGDFLLPAVDRLLLAWRAAGGEAPRAVHELADAVRAVEIHHASLARTQDRLLKLLADHGFTAATAATLADRWLVQDDFLLTDDLGLFDVVVGNPPYVRQERIPAALLAMYRGRYATLFDRADLYVLFFERSLEWLTPEGRLGFICANRWAKNKYGGPLRALVAERFALDAWIDLEGADAFEAVVDAYPAVTVIRRGEARPTVVASLAGRPLALFPSLVADMVARLGGPARPPRSTQVALHAVPDVARGRDPWLLDAPGVLTLIRRLEARLPTIEGSGAAVGIGVASGADRIFIGPYAQLPVEAERRLPLVMASDLHGAHIKWAGRGIVNPWSEAGKLVEMGTWPQFDAWLHLHREALTRRHVGQRTPTGWYRTIDRILPALTHQPKLLIPDIKGDATVVYDPGHYYPHHNLYVITSDVWALPVLQALLRSSFALAFVAAYCVRMSGGYLRFQAQYLRRIRVPEPARLSATLQRQLAQVAMTDDQAALDRVAGEAYGLSADERACLIDYAAAARVSGPTEVAA